MWLLTELGRAKEGTCLGEDLYTKNESVVEDNLHVSLYPLIFFISQTQN